MNLENLFKFPKYYFGGKKLHRDKKEIELMSSEELEKEILFVAQSAKKVPRLDDRTKELFREYFTYGLKADHDINILLTAALFFESEEVKEELFDLYFETNEVPIEFVDSNPRNIINFVPTNKVKMERAINNIKYMLNYLSDNLTKPFRKNTSSREEESLREMDGFLGLQTYKPNPLKLKISRKEEESFDIKNQETENYIRALIYKKCSDYINPESYLEYASNDLLLKIYDILPEDERKKFVARFVNTQSFIKGYRNAKILLEKIIPEIPREELLKFYIKHYEDGYPWLEQAQFSDEEVFEYFIDKKEYIPYGFRLRFDETLENQTFEQKIESLEKLEDTDTNFIAPLSRNITYEQLKELMANSSISPKVRDEAIHNAIYYLENENKVELFNSFSFDDQKKFFRSFVFSRKGKADYIDAIYDAIKDDDFKKMYGVLYKKEPISASDFINLINKIDYNFDYSKEFLLSYSDEELREIYDGINNERLKVTLLELNRKKETSHFFTKHLTPEEIEANKEYNKTVPDRILVNKDNIGHFFENAKSLFVFSSLMNMPEFRDKDFSEHLAVYKLFERKKDSFENELYATVESVEKQLKSELIYGANFIEFLQLARDGIIDKHTYFINGTNNTNIRGFNKDDIMSYLQIVSGVDDIEFKQEMLKNINQVFINGEYGDHSDRNKERDAIEKINGIYKEIIFNPKTSIEDKYLYFGAIVNNYYRKFLDTNRKEEHTIIAKELEEMFEKINVEAGKTGYNKIFDFSPEYVFSDISNREIISVSKYYNISECLPYLNSEKVYSLMQKLYKVNSGIQNNINKKFLDDNLIDSLDYEVIEYLSRYGKSIEDNPFKPQEITDEKMELFIKAYNRLKTIKTYPEEHALKLIDVIRQVSDEELQVTNFENDSGNLDLIILAALNPEIAGELKKITPQEGKNRFDEYQNSIKEKARDDVHSYFTTRRTVLNSIGKRFFNFSYKDMRRLKKKYDSDFKTIYESYIERASRQELSAEEENELKSLTIFRNISELLEIKDTNALIRVFDELDKSEEYENCNFAAMTVLEQNIKRIYSRDLQKNSYTLNEDDKIDVIDGIDVYSPREFKMFVHVIAAFGEYKLIDKDNPNVSSRDIWNSTKNKQNHILCTSYIGNEQMCYARWNPEMIKKLNEKKDDETIIFGFGNIENTEILMASQSDIGSRTTNLSSDESYFVSRFRLAEKIVRKCRHGHNEVDLERRQKNDKEKNIEPEFIVCFDEINESSKKVAKDFGIPIVMIDKRVVAKQQSEKINALITEFKESKNPKLLEPIINLYQCALASFNVGKKDEALREEFFDPEKMNEEVRNIISIIESERKIGNKQNAEECYLALFDAFEEELQICKEEYKGPEEYSNNRFHIREFRYEVKNIIKKNNITKGVSKTIEEDNPMYQTISTERRTARDGREDK